MNPTVRVLLPIVLLVSACGDALRGSGEALSTSGGAGLAQGPSAGTLTAGAWDDNLNFDFYLRYLENADASYLPDALTIPRADRVELKVVDGRGTPVAGARVTLLADDRELARMLTGADGIALAFPKWAGLAAPRALTARASFQGREVAVPVETDRRAAVLALADAAAPDVGALDVAIVLDTTGSMDDELDWLREELLEVGNRIARDFPGVQQRWALLTYRDEGDDYVTRVTPFANGLAQVRDALKRESADGGGDYPEALHTAFEQTASLDWRDGATARLAFVVTDAPYHQGTSARFHPALVSLRTKGVRVYPVAASGLDARGEHTLRSAAQVTGGRYLFLTDDSQVGEKHEEPTLPCFNVTRLDAQLRRAIAAEITGVVEQPRASEILRTGGNPEDGRCRLPDGQVVIAY